MIKKFTKASIFLIPIGFIIAIIGIVIIAIAPDPYVATSSDVETCEEAEVTYYPCSENSSDIFATYATNEVNSVEINSTSVDVDIFNDVEYTVGSNFNCIDVKCENGILKIDLNYSELECYDELEINVGIPRSCENLTINNTSGNISINDYKGNSAYISATSGNVDIWGTDSSGDFFIESVSGNVYIYNSDITNLNITVTSGDFTLYNTSLSHDNKINVTSGDVELTLKGFPADYTIQADVNARQLECDYDLDSYKSSKDTIALSVLNGNCTIEYYDYD